MKRLRLAMASDVRYLAGAIGTLASARMALDEGTAMDVVFLHDGLPESAIERLRNALARVRGETAIEFVEIEESFQGFPEFYFPSKLTYARLLLPSLQGGGRILYLDADILVLRSPWPLWERETGAEGLSAALETRIRTISGDWPTPGAGISLDEGAAYFNAGVLVLELDKIRESRLFEKAAGLLQSSSLSFKFWDQSALNYAANGKFDLLESDWNRQTHRGTFDPVEVIPGLARRSLNVHFVTPAKPWLAWSPFPAETMFRDLLDVVDPGWRGETFTAAESRTRRKLRFARWLGPFFALRGMVRKSASDRRIAEFWRIFSGDLDALRRRRIEVEDMLAGWRREISMKTR